MKAGQPVAESLTFKFAPYWFAGFQYVKGTVAFELPDAPGLNRLEYKLDYVAAAIPDRRVAFDANGFQGYSISQPIRAVTVFYAPALPFDSPAVVGRMLCTVDFFETSQSRDDCMTFGFLASAPGTFLLGDRPFRV